jgi:hypothetical protein
MTVDIIDKRTVGHWPDRLKCPCRSFNTNRQTGGGFCHPDNSQVSEQTLFVRADDSTYLKIDTVALTPEFSSGSFEMPGHAIVHQPLICSLSS